MNTACTCGLYVSIRYLGVTSNPIHSHMASPIVYTFSAWPTGKIDNTHKYALIQNIQLTMGSSIVTYMYSKLVWIIMLVVSVGI